LFLNMLGRVREAGAPQRRDRYGAHPARLRGEVRAFRAGL
jgi:hypothetical protein